MEITHTIDAVELAWTIASLVGLVLALDLLEQARYDRDVVRTARPVASSAERRDPWRRWRLEVAIVAGDVASARWIVAQELVSLAIGCIALAMPNPPGGRTPFGWVVVGGLILLAAMLPARLFGQRRRRRQLGLVTERSDRPAS